MKGPLLRLPLGALGLGFLCACPSTPHDTSVHDYLNQGMKIPPNQVSIYFGSRDVMDFDALDVDPGPSQNLLDVSKNTFGGIEYSEIIRSTVGWEFGLFYSRGEDSTLQTVPNFGTPEVVEVKTDIEFIELSLGGRYTYTGFLYVQPYLGLGVDFIVANIPRPETTTVQDPDSDPDDPTFVETVVEYPNHRKHLIGGYAHAGVNFRVGHILMGLDARTLFWADDDVNYVQAAVTLGWAF